MDGDNDRELGLIGLLCDELIDDRQFEDLDEILLHDLSLREAYRSFVGMHHELEQGALLAKEWGAEDWQAQQKLVPTSRCLVNVCSAVALLVFAAIGWMAFHLDLKREQPVAVLTRSIEVEWSHPTRNRGKLGEALGKGWLDIDSGVVEVTFSSGASLSMEGPARLKIDSAMNCFSDFGKLVVSCPESAFGFTVQFRGGKVVDLGTEFALNTRTGEGTNVYVLEGAVDVMLLDNEKKLLQQLTVLKENAVNLTFGKSQLTYLSYDQKMFDGLRRESLVKLQPIKLQFDIGQKAGLYRGVDAPAHKVGDMFAHENQWSQIVGDQSGAFVLADGNICPFSINVDYGHGKGRIDWEASPVTYTATVYKRAKGVANTALCLDNLHHFNDLGVRISGLPKGRYRVYALCRSFRRPKAAYAVSIGTNLDQLSSNPIEVGVMGEALNPSWVSGETYAVGEVEISKTGDWLTIITRSVDDGMIGEPYRNKLAVLLGLQIVGLE